MRTRTSKSAKTAKENSDPSSTELILEQDPLRLLLLPRDAPSDARIYTLAHPSTSKPTRYYWCLENGLYEFRRIVAPKKLCRSWLLGPKLLSQSDSTGAETLRGDEVQSIDQLVTEKSYETTEHGINGESKEEKNAYPSQGHTIKAPEVFVATSIDFLFIMLPCLYDQISKSSKGLFLSWDDLLDNAAEKSKHLRDILDNKSNHPEEEARVAAVCDTVRAGFETMYRLNMDKLVHELVAKAKRMSSNGLPASMEAKFIEKALEVPMMSLKREASSITHTTTEAVSSVDSPSTITDSQSTTTGESQSSTKTNESVDSELSIQTNITAPNQPTQPTVSQDIKDLLRLRTALNFIIMSYLPASLASEIQTLLSSPSSPVNFKPLDDHLTHLAKLRSEALASRSLGDFSRKRNTVEDDEAAEAKAEKRRKKEEEEKRQKIGLTKAVRDLKKVDVTGMKKMSDFFGKKAAPGKK
ncbi:MAG: hypothetical protein Q9166_002508 [cf. Caloplaca sp. 2 TL-2023]